MACKSCGFVVHSPLIGYLVHKKARVELLEVCVCFDDWPHSTTFLMLDVAREHKYAECTQIEERKIAHDLHFDTDGCDELLHWCVQLRLTHKFECLSRQQQST